MAAVWGVSSLQDVAISEQERRTTMHPLGLYLVITAGQPERRLQFAREDAPPIVEPEPVSRFGRLAALVRRRVLRTVGA